MEFVNWCRCVLVISITVLTTGCRHRKNAADRFPYRQGCYLIRWGAGVAATDSLVRADSSWNKISSVLNSKTNGKTLVARHQGRDYYLEFSDRDRFFSMNYISDHADLDSVSAMILRYYGEPDKLERRNDRFEDRMWHVEGDSVDLEIQLLITPQDYSLSVLNKKIVD